MKIEQTVFDTNALISAMLWDQSVPAHALELATRAGILLMSEATMAEFGEVSVRRKFDKYLPLGDRLFFMEHLAPLVRLVPISLTVAACRDPRDDKFLEVAVNGGASCIVTGDDDLLALNPFRGIDILTPRDFLAHEQRMVQGEDE